MRIHAAPRIVSIISLMVFSWSMCLLFTVVPIVLPDPILNSIVQYMPYLKLLWPETKHLRKLISNQEFSLRCITITDVATQYFLFWIKEIMIIALLAHWNGAFDNILLFLENTGLSFLMVPFQYCFAVYREIKGFLSGENYDEEDCSDDNYSEPPALELDPLCLHMVEQEAIVSSPMVFDRVLGLIPEEVKDRWLQQQEEREIMRKKVQSARQKKTLPPVRNWDYSQPLSSNTTLSIDTTEGKEVIVQQTEASVLSPTSAGAPMWDSE